MMYKWSLVKVGTFDDFSGLLLTPVHPDTIIITGKMSRP